MIPFKKGFNLIDKDLADVVMKRFNRISKAIKESNDLINKEDIYSYFVGSYGRNTAINTSDIDIMVVMPKSVFEQFNKHVGNGQSHLLQDLKGDISETYPRTNKNGDGQVVVVKFTDGMKFEVLPAFKGIDGAYYHPDTHDGGSWEPTYPFLEQKAMRLSNKESNGLLYDTCRYIRHIRDNCFKDKKLSGIVIDSFVYGAIGQYRWPPTYSLVNSDPYNYIEHYSYIEHLHNAYEHLNRSNGKVLYAPGSRDVIPINDSLDNLGKVINRWLENTNNN